VRVLRVRRGSEVRLFNGRGYECEAVVENPAPAGLTLRIVGPVCPRPEPRVRLTLAQAVLKGDGMDEVVRDAVMLGVRAIVPVVSARAETDRARLLKARRRERWQRIAVSSAKQCGRAVVPEVHEPVTFEEIVAALADPIRLMLAEPAVEGSAALDLSSLPGPVSAALLAGPEGGWTASEVSLATSSGWARLTLGSRTLRADAAAAVAIPVLQYLWGDL
jgi:16S rRNA (uracil1498-N3)-methyltransferase